MSGCMHRHYWFYDLPWSNLIENAASWKYGKKMTLRNEAIDFIKFTIDVIN